MSFASYKNIIVRILFAIISVTSLYDIRVLGTIEQFVLHVRIFVSKSTKTLMI